MLICDVNVARDVQFDIDVRVGLYFMLSVLSILMWSVIMMLFVLVNVVLE